MANITSADIVKLRKITLAGMMDCKRALEEADGNFDKAIEIIRKKGQLIASKRADRLASEGAVLAKVSPMGNLGAMIVLNSETDFVARNAEFLKLAENILNIALANAPENLDALKALKLDGTIISEKIVEYIGVIGEKIDLSFYEKIEAPYVHAYVHPGNRLASLAGFSKAGLDIQIYKDIAMQIAAMNPIAIDRDDVKPEIIAQEIEIGKEQARLEGKPEAMLEKIAQGKLSKFFKENTLLNQEFIKDNKITVKQYIQSADKELKVTGFVRYALNQ